jgi:hypothetical protein
VQAAFFASQANALVARPAHSHDGHTRPPSWIDSVHETHEKRVGIVGRGDHNADGLALHKRGEHGLQEQRHGRKVRLVDDDDMCLETTYTLCTENESEQEQARMSDVWIEKTKKNKKGGERGVSGRFGASSPLPPLDRKRRLTGF